MKINIVIAALIAAMFFPFDTDATLGKPTEPQSIRIIEKKIEQAEEVEVCEKECNVERLVIEKPNKPVRKLIGKLRLRKK